MERWQTGTGLGLVIDAMALAESEAEVQRLVAAFGGSPRVRDRRVGEPGLLSRRSTFPNGGQIVSHDDAVVAVVLPLRSPEVPEWIPGVASATLSDLAAALGSKPRFEGVRSPYFEVGGAYLRADFEGDWNEGGSLRGLAVLAEEPGRACNPLDDDCPVCADLLVRDGDAVDVDATIAALAEGLSSSLLRQDPYRVSVADLKPLHASGLMARAECQLTCSQCRRIVCFALVRDGSPVLEYCVFDEARRHPIEAVPPGALPSDPGAMHYVDHEPGAWFLARRGDELFLSVRYALTPHVDGDALIRLDDEELAGYRTGGREWMGRLADRVGDSLSSRAESPFRARDLSRDPSAGSVNDEFSAAIAGHTWRSEQNRARG